MQINGMSDAALAAAAEGRAQGLAKGAGRTEEDAAQAKKVAREFEAMFVGMMLKSMRETVGEDKLTGGGRAEETYRALLDQEYAAEAVRAGGIGLAQVLERELNRNGGAPRVKAPGEGVDRAY